jgi:hypothetical protein
MGLGASHDTSAAATAAPHAKANQKIWALDNSWNIAILLVEL